MMTASAIRMTASRHNAAVARGHDVPTAGHPLLSPLDMMGTVMSYERNSEVYGEQEPAEFLYKVVSGSVRICKLLSDGRRQIQAFHTAGDIFGFEFGAEHEFSAEAIADSRVLVVKRSAVMALAARDAGVARELWSVTARELQRAQSRGVLLIKTAQERVVSFLLEMASRARRDDAVELPMSRQDIADYLGLTIETVSRTLTGLESAAAIALPTSRRVVLRDFAALNRLDG